jgi:hypothetical protein
MQLSEADRQKILDWITQKCGKMRCTCCGNGQWTIIGAATLPIGFDLHTTRFFYSEGIPQISIACNNCGHMLFFNSGIIGFRPDEPAQAEIPPANTSA